MKSVTKLKCLAEEDLLPGCCLREEPFVGHVVDVLDGNDFFLYLIEVVDECAVSCRTEKERVCLCSERLVLHVYCDSVCSLVLEGEGDVVGNSVLRLVSGLHFSISLLEEVLVLRRDGNDEVCCAVVVSHIVLSLDKMLRECGADLSVGIFMELKDSLRLRAVAESLVCECL